jgi:hypothetical protein
MAASSAFYYKQELATPISAEANMSKANVKCSGQSQNWLVEYVNKANNGGIERVLL